MQNPRNLDSEVRGDKPTEGFGVTWVQGLGVCTSRVGILDLSLRLIDINRRSLSDMHYPDFGLDGSKVR